MLIELDKLHTMFWTLKGRRIEEFSLVVALLFSYFHFVLEPRDLRRKVLFIIRMVFIRKIIKMMGSIIGA